MKETIVRNDKLLVGLTIDRFKGISPTVFLTIVRKMGVEFIEITKSVFDDLASFVANLGMIQTGFHLPNCHDAGFDFSSHERESEIERLVDLINRHHRELHIKYCLSHPPESARSGRLKNEPIAYLLNNLKMLEPPIILENVQGWDQQKFERFYSQAQEFLGEKLIGQCFDAPHYFLRGEDPVEYLVNTNGKIQFIHLSDCRSGYDAHLPFGLSGELPIDAILSTLKQQNYKGVINLELLPRKISDIRPLIQSYLKVVGNFDRIKYYKTKLRLILYIPALIKTMKKVI
jgi:hypothetical protein